MVSLGSSMSVTPACDLITRSTHPGFQLAIVNRQVRAQHLLFSAVC
jgi:hypothetical protein